MTEYYNSRRDSRPRARPSSQCARCGNLRQETRDVSQGRGSWAEKGRGLSLEVDGREGRRRNSSADTRNGKQRGTPVHCFILPIANGQGSTAATSSTTYRESFRSPTGNPGMYRRVISAPTSPVSASSMWSPASSKTTQNTSNRQTDASSLLSRMPSRLSSRDSNLGRSDTTYRDHFTWMP